MTTAVPPEHRGIPTASQSGDTIREWDRRAIEEYGIPAVVLMENAGAAAARTLRKLALGTTPETPAPFRIFCGPGNNGGDGFVIARYLHNFGYPVELFLAGAPRYRPDSESAIQLTIVDRVGLPLTQLHNEAAGVEAAAQKDGTIIDAIFGTGLSRPIGPPYAAWIEAMNGSARPTVAIDLPSGLDADTGAVHGIVVEARHTITFAARKHGLDRGEGPQVSGIVHVHDIGLPPALWEE